MDDQTASPTHRTRRRRHVIPLEARPAPVQAEVTRLRREAKNYRLRLRETEAELSEARQRIAVLMMDNADLQAGIIPTTALHR